MASNNTDTEPPGFESGPDVSARRLPLGGTCTLSFTVDEPLHRAPVVVATFDGTDVLFAADEAASRPSERVYQYSFVASFVAVVPGEITIGLIDAVGNAIDRPAGTIAVDADGPEVGQPSWTLPFAVDGQTRAARSDTVTFNALSDFDADLPNADAAMVTAELVNARRGAWNA